MGKLKYAIQLNYNKGFTLIELMVSLVISFIVTFAIYEAFTSQNKSYIIQEGIVEMQQTLRGTLLIIERDIRSAGYDPSDTSLYTINTAIEPLVFPPLVAPYGSVLGFSADLNDDGGAPGGGATAEIFLYELYNPVVTAGSTVYSLRRTPGGTAIAENIEDFRIAYAYDANSDNNIDLTAGNNIIWAYPNAGNWWQLDTDDNGVIDQLDAAGGVNTGTPVVLADIRAVRVWVLVRNDKPDREHLDTKTYVVGSNRITPNDNFRRVLLDINIKCRNMGM
ncbi:MAG: PilW family protein [Desulfamplus sp.]|nr:PilW family protein [Desulfamplus sp.]